MKENRGKNEKKVIKWQKMFWKWENKNKNNKINLKREENNKKISKSNITEIYDVQTQIVKHSDLYKS